MRTIDYSSTTDINNALLRPVESITTSLNEDGSVPQPHMSSRPAWMKSLYRTSTDEDGPVEATGLALDSFARGSFIISSLFLGPALLELAKAAAGSECDDNSGDDEVCEQGEGRVYGMRPTSLLTNIGVVTGLASAALLPLFGAIVDHTPHRRLIGGSSAIILAIVKGLEIFISQYTWFAVSIAQVLNGVIYNAHLCAVYAYTAELSTLPAEQTRYNANFQGIQFASMLFFITVLMIISTHRGVDDVGTARISQTMTFFTCTSVFGYAWFYFFRDRPALTRVPSDSTVMKCGFRKLYETFSMIWHEWHPLRYFLLSVMLSQSATAALSTISTTFMIHFLGMDSGQVGLLFFLVTIAAIPGSKLGGLVGVWLNPLRSAMVCLVILVVNTSSAAYFMKGPEQQNLMYFFGIIWGICLGWLHPTQAALYCTIIPRGQEGELMGVYIFCGSVMTWLPPLFFSFLNEVGASMRIGMASLNFFFTGAFLLLLPMGSFKNAVDSATVHHHDAGSYYNAERDDRRVEGQSPLPIAVAVDSATVHHHAVSSYNNDERGDSRVQDGSPLPIAVFL